jgi:hypothetical protein
MAVIAGGAKGSVHELRELRRTVEGLKADLAKARDDEETHRRAREAAELRLAQGEASPPEYVPPPIETRQARWRANPARITKPEERALARSIAEQEWDSLRRMSDRVVEDYGA